MAHGEQTFFHLEKPWLPKVKWYHQHSSLADQNMVWYGDCLYKKISHELQHSWIRKQVLKTSWALFEVGKSSCTVEHYLEKAELQQLQLSGANKQVTFLLVKWSKSNLLSISYRTRWVQSMAEKVGLNHNWFIDIRMHDLYKIY